MPREAPKKGWRRFLDVDPAPILAASDDPAISLFAKRDLLGARVDATSALWELPVARKTLARQRANGSWPYPGGNTRIRTRESYDQLETFRQVGVLVEKLGFTRAHPAIERAADFLFSFQTEEGDFRGIYGEQYATTYVGAITELLVKSGYADDARIAKGFRWLLSVRQDDGGWAIPMRTVGIPFSEFVDRRRHPKPIPPDTTKSSSHLVTGMVLRAFAVHPQRRRSHEALRAAAWLAERLYRKDAYGDRGAVEYWERVSFPFWFTDVVSALDTLSRIGLDPDTPTIRAALERVRHLQRPDGTFRFRLMKGKDEDLPQWICLAVARSVARWLDPRATVLPNGIRRRAVRAPTRAKGRER